MTRLQLHLTDEQVRGLRRVAAERGLSMAAVVRELVADALRVEQRGRIEQALAALGRFRSGVGRVSTEHDQELDDAYRA